MSIGNALLICIIITIIVLGVMLMSALDRIRQEVTEARAIQSSALALISGLAEQIRANIGNEDELNALANELDASSNELAAAVAANTPSEGEEPTGDEEGDDEAVVDDGEAPVEDGESVVGEDGPDEDEGQVNT